MRKLPNIIIMHYYPEMLIQSKPLTLIPPPNIPLITWSVIDPTTIVFKICKL